MYKSNLNATWGPKTKDFNRQQTWQLHAASVDKVQWAQAQQRAAAASFVVAATVAVAVVVVAVGSVAAAAAAHIS